MGGFNTHLSHNRARTMFSRLAAGVSLCFLGLLQAGFAVVGAAEDAGVELQLNRIIGPIVGVLDVSADGKVALVKMYDTRISLISTETAKVLGTLRSEADRAYFSARLFSGGREIVAVTNSGDIDVLDARTLKRVRGTKFLGSHSRHSVFTVDVSRSGRILVTQTSPLSFAVYDSALNEPLFQWSEDFDHVFGDTAVSLDGNIVAVLSQEVGLRVFDVEKKCLIWQQEMYVNVDSRLSFGGEGVLAFSTRSIERVEIVVVEARTAVEKRRILVPHASFFGVFGMSEDGRFVIATVSRPDGIIVFDSVTGDEVRSFPTPGTSLRGACFSGDSNVAVTSSESGRGIQAWRLSDGRQMFQAESATGDLKSIDALGSGTHVVANTVDDVLNGGEGDVWRWSDAIARPESVLKGNISVAAIATRRDGLTTIDSKDADRVTMHRQVTALRGRPLTLRSVRQDDQRDGNIVHDDAMLVLTPGAARLLRADSIGAEGDDDLNASCRVQVFDLARCSRTFDREFLGRGEIRKFDCRNDRLLIVFSAGLSAFDFTRRQTIADPDIAKEIVVKGENEWGEYDDRVVTGALDRKAEHAVLITLAGRVLWVALANGKIVRQRRLPKGVLARSRSIEWLADGRRCVIYTSDHGLLQVDLLNGAVLRRYHHRMAGLPNGEFKVSEDGRRLFSCSISGSIGVFDAESGALRGELFRLNHGADWLAVDSRGRFDGSVEGRAMVMGRETRTGRKLSADEVASRFEPGLIGRIMRAN